MTALQCLHDRRRPGDQRLSQASGPVSTLTAMSLEGLWLDIWGVFNNVAMPVHPADPPSVRVFLEYVTSTNMNYGDSDFHAIEAEQEHSQMLAHGAKFMGSLNNLKESVRLDRERLDADIRGFEASKATFLAEKKGYEDDRKHLEAAKAEGMRRRRDEADTVGGHVRLWQRYTSD